MKLQVDDQHRSRPDTPTPESSPFIDISTDGNAFAASNTRTKNKLAYRKVRRGATIHAVTWSNELWSSSTTDHCDIENYLKRVIRRKKQATLSATQAAYETSRAALRMQHLSLSFKLDRPFRHCAVKESKSSCQTQCQARLVLRPPLSVAPQLQSEQRATREDDKVAPRRTLRSPRSLLFLRFAVQWRHHIEQTAHVKLLNMQPLRSESPYTLISRIRSRESSVGYL